MEAARLYESKKAACIVLLKRTDKPKRYGIVEVEREGRFEGHSVVRVLGAEEKPEDPKTDIMLSAVYLFNPKIFGYLQAFSPGLKRGTELQLTWGIDRLARDGGRVYGIMLEKERWLNIGNPESYHDTLNYTYEHF